MRKIVSSTIDVGALNSTEQLYIYNCLDTCLTFEINEKLTLDKPAELIYNFEFALQAPALEMMLRGLKVDPKVRNDLIIETESKITRVKSILFEFAVAVWGKDLNPNSPAQLKDFFYSVMGLPEIKKFDPKKGKSVPTTNREALEKLSAYIHARPIINCILSLREQIKFLSVLHKGIDRDGRIRTSYNVAGTETGRWSSSSNAFGSGDNLQNWTDEVRQIIVADPGKKLCYIDLEQAESRAVAYISEDVNYIEACNSGDLHTITCRMVWKMLKWGNNLKEDREVADQKFYRHFSYRDMSKRGGHGSNYRGTAQTMAKHLKVPTQVIERFQQAYFSAFNRIPIWHINVARTLQLTGFLTTALGRRRGFFDRLDDDATVRAAIAYEPQSIVGDILNLALWRLWKHMGTRIEILAQVHDAVLFQFDERLENSIIPEALSIMTIPVPVKGRVMTIPCEASVGWTWRKHDKKAPLETPDGLIKYDGHDRRTRTKAASVLEFIVS